jgi:hypothetical protein
MAANSPPMQIWPQNQSGVEHRPDAQAWVKKSCSSIVP